jgi:hypothetical protein
MNPILPASITCVLLPRRQGAGGDLARITFRLHAESRAGVLQQGLQMMHPTGKQRYKCQNVNGPPDAFPLDLA